MIRLRDPLEAAREKRRMFGIDKDAAADLAAIPPPPEPKADDGRRKWIVCIPGQPVRRFDRE